MLKGMLQGKPRGKRSKGWSREGRATLRLSVPCAVRSGTRFGVPPKSRCDGEPLRASQNRVARSHLLQGGNWRREPTAAMPSARGFGRTCIYRGLVRTILCKSSSRAHVRPGLLGCAKAKAVVFGCF